MPNANKDIKIRNSCSLDGKFKLSALILWKSLEVPQKSKSSSGIGSNYMTSGHLAKENEVIMAKITCKSTIYNC